MSTKKHTAYNIAGAAAPIVLMLITVPLYLGVIGEARYGVLAIFWVLIGYFGFFDFGLGRATAYAISRLKDGTDEERARTFWTAIIVNAGLGLVGGAILYFVSGLLFQHVFNFSSDLLDELRPVLIFIGFAIPLLTLEGVLTGALMGRDEFLAMNIRAVAGTAITQSVPLFCVWYFAPTLTVAVPAAIGARALSVAILVFVAFRSVPAGPVPIWGGKSVAKELLGYGGWVGLSSALNPLISNLDRFLIASYLNATAVAHYAVPLQLVVRGSFISNALTTALFPRLARLSAVEAREMGWRAIKANAGLMLVLCTAGILIMRPFLSLWIDEDFADSAALIGECLAIALWLNAIALVPFNLLQAQGRPKETTLVMILQLIPFVAVAIPALTLVGVVGIALARNVRSVVDVVMLTYRTGLLRKTLGLGIPPLGLMIAAIGCAEYADVESRGGLLWAVLLLAAAGAWALLVSEDLRSAMRTVPAIAISRLRSRTSAVSQDS